MPSYIVTTNKQLTPYLLYEGGKVNVSGDGHSYTVSIEVKNFGQTPAYSVTNWFTSKAMPPLRDPFKYFYPPGARRPYEISPNDPVTFRETQQEGASDTAFGQSLCIQKKFSLPDLPSRSEVIYVWGDVKYVDSFHPCQFEVFILQSIDPITNGATLKLAKVMNWGPTNKRGCTDDHKAKLDWWEDAAEEATPPIEPKTAVLQGACPN